METAEKRELFEHLRSEVVGWDKKDRHDEKKIVPIIQHWLYTSEVIYDGDLMDLYYDFQRLGARVTYTVGHAPVSLIYGRVKELCDDQYPWKNLPQWEVDAANTALELTGDHMVVSKDESLSAGEMVRLLTALQVASEYLECDTPDQHEECDETCYLNAAGELRSVILETLNIEEV